MLITHAVSITMPQIAFDLQMAGMTCTHFYGGTSAESRAQTSRWIGSLRLFWLLIRLRSIWSMAVLPLRSMIWSNESKAAAHCQGTRDGQ